MPDYVYRIVSRRADSDDEWTQDDSWQSRTGRPYTNGSTAKGEATRRKGRYPFYEYKVQRAAVAWEDVP